FLIYSHGTVHSQIDGSLDGLRVKLPFFIFTNPIPGSRVAIFIYFDTISPLRNVETEVFTLINKYLL
ncbi:MAG: hypothetical protein ACPKPY_11160, partial [Nitrososphaeraceae archaeon]